MSDLPPAGDEGPAPRSFAFGPFVLVPEHQLLLQDGVPVRIGCRALDILTALVERPGELQGKRELMARVWPSTVVEECNLKVNMAALRRALGDGAGAARYIATVTGRGYRFVAPVQAGRLSGFEPPAAPPATAQHNLPFAITRLFGRDDAVAAIRRDLAEARLVTIVGAGGIGKTSVALAVAEQALGTTADGVWMVDLALLRDAALVPQAIATATGTVIASTDVGALCALLRQREMLLVLDNCEHLVDAVAACVERLLATTSRVKVLATSREPLGLAGEHVHRLPGLAAPEPAPTLSAAQALAFPAVQLFVDRAASSFEPFRLSDADAPVVAQICARLDGLALAIEFAATRIEAFGVAGVLQQLDDRFRLLVGRRAGPQRQRTLAATLDWSYGLLSPREATLLRAVSVFAGLFDVEGAAAVAEVAPAQAAETLAQLVAKSLLATDLDSDHTVYRCLETTRSYCLERLQAGGDEATIRQRHAAHVCAVLERAAHETRVRAPRDWGAAWRRYLDDLRAALLWTARDERLRALRIRLTLAGGPLWNHCSLTEECRVHTLQAVEQLDAAGLSGSACEMQLQLFLAGATIFARGMMTQALAAARRALEIAERLDDDDHRLRALRMLAAYELFTGHHDAAIGTLERFLAIVHAAARPDAGALAAGSSHLALGELFVGRLERSRRRLEPLMQPAPRGAGAAKSATRFQYDSMVDVGNVLANTQWLTGAPDTACKTMEATVELALTTSHELSLSNALAVAACPLCWLCGRDDEALRYLALLEEQVARRGLVAWHPLALFYRGALACARDPRSAEGYDALQRSLEEFQSVAHRARLPYYLGVTAEVVARRGQLDEAAARIEAALERERAMNEAWCRPELLRIHAAILAAAGRRREAEAKLAESMAFAQDIGALSWRLRAATDLARLWRDAARPDDARRLLAPVYGAYTEGHATRDLQVAAELLASLPGNR